MTNVFTMMPDKVSPGFLYDEQAEPASASTLRMYPFRYSLPARSGVVADKAVDSL
jgi:hypothetical protein